MSAFSLALLAASLVSTGASAQGPSTAFCYGNNPPLEVLASFQQIVLQPEAVSTSQLQTLQAGGGAAFAYLSVGELAPGQAWAARAQPSWKIGANSAWGTWIMDPAQAGWRELLLARAAALRAQGFAGLFLDTLDSPAGAAPTPESRRQAWEALGALITELKRRDPAVRLLFNRGFELLPRFAPLAAGVVAESLLRTFDPARHTFAAADPEGTRWLEDRLREARDVYHLPVVVIDYVPSNDRALARKTARAIAAKGFVPWVTDPSLEGLGVGLLEAVPRRVLLIYDGAESPDGPDRDDHRFATVPLEALGYAVVPHDARLPLPRGRLADRYAGIVLAMTDDSPPSAEYRPWLLEQLDAGMRLAFLGHLGVAPDAALLARLGLAAVPFEGSSARIARSTKLLGFEARLRLRTQDLQPWRATGPGADPQLSLVDGRGSRVDPVVFLPFGGLALEPFVTDPEYDEGNSWILDPFEFFRRALQLEPVPALDVTTENGLRLLETHIDGDGFSSRAEFPGAPLAGAVMLDKVLRRRALPITVSFIEAEVSPAGEPAARAEREELARRIFALPNVEPATHSYSHPFHWVEAPGRPRGGMTLPGYRFDLAREIDGSVAGLQRLAPPGKRLGAVLWSGDALPDEQALARTAALGLENLNGGNSRITNDARSLTGLFPMGRWVGAQYQVYAPISNENVFTNLWHGPFDGYRRAIESFQLTDSPRRLKAISIYFHFYSASKRSALHALDGVLDWATAQETLPLPASDYARRAQEYQRALLLRTLDGGYVLRGTDALRTLRLPASLGWPDLARSPGVAAVRDLPQGRYVTFSRAGPTQLALGPARPGLHVATANGEILEEQRTFAGLDLHARGWVPLELGLEGPGAGSCVVQKGPAARRTVLGPQRVRFRFATPDPGPVSLRCASSPAG